MTPRDHLRAELRAGLLARGAEGLLRSPRLPEGLDLTSNDVLDLARDPWIAARVAERVLERGVGAGASRLLRGHGEAIERLEARLAGFCGREAALLFPSGYQANATVIPALVGAGDLIFSDAANHASLIDGVRLSKARRVLFPHGDIDALGRALAEPGGGRRLVVVESMHSMDGDRAPLESICQLAEAHGALVYVDEAHATALFGARGSGLVEAAGLSERVTLTVHTGGKALGSSGAWVAGDAELIAHLTNHCRGFIYTTAPPTALVAALDAALERIGQVPERVARVHALAATLRRALARGGLQLGRAGDHIVPVVLGSAERAVAVSDALARDGFDARAVRPPTVAPGTARLRIVVRSSLDAPTLERLAARIIHHARETAA
ncbi:MAG: 8-amino-7-oxononanoate synthase [Deltaproteobacteria bacterium]|nr:8-amino-7-oxononanoate synthase [Deltaproteobacteria bacterium]MCB9787832.1 8-amino-7-oxononanoate synthase [Deltaproteobacteria bacterium]